MGSQSICSGLKDFLLWVVLGRETQNNTQYLFLPLLFSLYFSEPLLPPKLLLFIAKVSGEITISASVSAIEGPILSDLSGYLGESGVQQLWPWNLVPA